MKTIASVQSSRSRILWRRARRQLRRSRLHLAGAAASIAMCGLLLLTAATIKELTAQRAAAADVARTLQVLDAIYAIRADTADALNEGRAFLENHAAIHRRRFEVAGWAARDGSTQLSRQVAEQPDQLALADRMRSLIAGRLNLLRDAMEHAPLANPEAGHPEIGHPEPARPEDVAQAQRLQNGRLVAEAMSYATARLVAHQRQRLAEREAAMQAAMRGTLLGLSLSGTCLALGLTLAIAQRASNQRRVRRMHRTNALLQKSIRLRTIAFTASETKLRTYLMHLADGVSAIRVAPDGSFVYEEMNAAARTMLDIGGRDVDGLALHEIYRNEDECVAMADRLRECVQADMQIRYNKTVITRRGRRELRVSLVPVRSEPTAMYPQGRIDLLLHTMRDVTGEVEREERLRQSQRVEAVGRLTAGVAHDFNNLLQALMGGLELAMPEVADRPEATESIQVALQAARRGAQLTSQLLSFSGQQILRPVPLDLPPQLHGLAATLERTLGPNIRAEVAVAPGLPPAFVDPAHLGSALLNLALNARDAMPDGGTLRIEAYAAGPDLVLAVSDTGAGMSPEVLARACEPFYTTKGVNGTGLGLSMAQGFARQSGGDLRIRSRLGNGTRVEIVLLPAPAAARPEQAPGTETPSRGVGRILIVDDEADVRQVTSAFLRKAGFETVTARDADIAMSLLSAGPRFDVLVTDYAMAGMNGVDLVLQAREIVPHQPALIITGYAGAEGLRWLPPDVMTLRKPFARADFVNAVRDLVEAPAASLLPAPVRTADIAAIGAA